MKRPVCVTGATGYVGSHVVNAFLEAGFPVRAAVRSPEDQGKTAHLVAMAERHQTTLSLHHADLHTTGSFDEALAGCEGLIHVAAVARLSAPEPQRQIVDPSVTGARNVLEAATRQGVRRVVLTSSIAAVGNYRSSQQRPLTEDDWNETATLESDPYGLAKREAERFAWRESEGAPWDLVVINPGMVMGPVFNKRHSRASPIFVRDILRKANPAHPKICLPIVDARDVAFAHLAAYRRPDATGRHIVASENRWIREIAETLTAEYPDRGLRTSELPNVVVKLAATFSKHLDRHLIADTLGRRPQYDGSHAPSALGFTYRDVDETLLETARSMVSLGLV